MGIAGRGRQTVLAIPDLHAPFTARRALSFVRDVADRVQPDSVVFLGDEIDAHALSRYAPDPDGLAPAAELRAARRVLRPWFDAFPAAKVCTSNHAQRAARKAFGAGLPSDVLRPLRDVLDAPETWQWADEWVIDDVAYVHGEQFGGLDAVRKAAVNYGRSVVFGHLHTTAGIVWNRNPSRTTFGFATGCLIDPSAYAFRYAAHSLRRPLLGVGVIDKGVPQWIPFTG